MEKYYNIQKFNKVLYPQLGILLQEKFKKVERCPFLVAPPYEANFASFC